MAVSYDSIPIWMGYSFSFAASKCPLDYIVILDDAGEIYRGRAMSRPNNAGAIVQLQELLAPYCRQSELLPDDLAAGPQANILANGANIRGTFYSYEADGVNRAQAFSVYANWTYGKSAFVLNNTRTILSEPVRAEIDIRMPLIVSTACSRNNGDAYLSVGGTILATYSLGAGPKSLSVRSDNLDSFATSAAGKTVRMSMTNPAGSREWSPSLLAKSTCKRWALYYVNALGGWDHIIMHGQVRESDTFAREVVPRHVTAPYLLDVPGSRAVSTEITHTWELDTGWLNDDESARFSLHVPGTPAAYLYDMLRAQFIPVNIIDTEMRTNLTMATNGRRPVSYTLTAQLNRDRLRY